MTSAAHAERAESYYVLLLRRLLRYTLLLCDSAQALLAAARGVRPKG